MNQALRIRTPFASVGLASLLAFMVLFAGCASNLQDDPNSQAGLDKLYAEAKEDLTGVMAKEMQSARALERVQSDIARYEGLAVEALDKAQESLAEEVAGKIAALEVELQTQSQAHAAYAVQVTKLKDLIKTAETRIREHEREIGVAKTTESVYRATQSISESIGQGGNKLVSARESLERIKARHEDLADRMTAAEQLDNEFGHGALEKKLATAGIGDESRRQSAVMDRIRAKRQAATPDAGQGGG